MRTNMFFTLDIVIFIYTRFIRYKSIGQKKKKNLKKARDVHMYVCVYVCVYLFAASSRGTKPIIIGGVMTFQR